MTPPSPARPRPGVDRWRRSGSGPPFAAAVFGCAYRPLGGGWCQLANGGGPGRTAPPAGAGRSVTGAGGASTSLARGNPWPMAPAWCRSSGAGAEGGAVPSDQHRAFRPESQTGRLTPHQVRTFCGRSRRAPESDSWGRASAGREVPPPSMAMNPARPAGRSGRADQGGGANPKSSAAPLGSKRYHMPRSAPRAGVLHQSPRRTGGGSRTSAGYRGLAFVPSTTGLRSAGNWGGCAGGPGRCCGIGAQPSTLTALNMPRTDKPVQNAANP